MKRKGYTSGLLSVLFAVLVTANVFGCNRKMELTKIEAEVERKSVIDEAELMNDEYYRARIDLIREHIESFICGDIENGVLEPYKAIVQRDFRIVDMHGVMGGGIYFRFVFPNHPNDVFQVFTSIDVDDETDSITAYHLGEFKKIENCTDK